MNGLLVEYRHRIAWLAQKVPAVARALLVARWWAWSAVGWPFTTGAILAVVVLVLAGGTRLWLPGGLLGFIWTAISAVVAVWPAGVDGALTAGMVVLLCGGWFAWFRWRYEIPFARFATVMLVAVVATNVWATVWWLGWTHLVMITLLVTAMVIVDQVMPFVTPVAGLVRRWAEFRRELPAHWTDLASRSDRIQGIDVSIERSVTQGAKERPILEHPALGTFTDTRFDLAGFAIECPIARPEGRTFEALAQVLNDLAAQSFGVGNWAGSIRLVDVESNAASSAVLRVEFNRPTLRRPVPEKPGAVIDLDQYRRANEPFGQQRQQGDQR